MKIYNLHNGFSKKSACCIAILATLLAAPARESSAILVNLNFTDVAYSGNTETSPATPAGPAGVWNNLTTVTLNAANSAETNSVVLLDSGGNSTPALTLDASSTTNVWTGASFSFANTDYTTGVYDVPNLYQSGMLNGGNNTTGFRLRGLDPGTYEIFLVPYFRGAQTAGVKADPAVSLIIGLGNTTDARNAGDHTLTSTANSVTQNVATNLTSWTAATGSTPYNYVGATVTIDSSSRWLTFLLQDSATSGPDRASLSTLQIRTAVAVPELSPFLLIPIAALFTLSTVYCRNAAPGQRRRVASMRPKKKCKT